MKKNHKVLVSVLLALFLHGLFVPASMFIRLPGLAQVAERISRTFHITTIDVRPKEPRQQGVVSSRQMVESLRFVDEAQAASAKPLPDVPVGPFVDENKPANAFPEEELRKDLEALESAIERVPEEDAPEAPKEEIPIDEKIPAAEVPTESPLPRFSELIAQEGREDDEGLLTVLEAPEERLTAYSPQSTALDPELGMPGFTPASFTAEEGVLSNLEAEDGAFTEPRRQITSFEAVDPFMDIKVYTYQDPASGLKYFMIKIFAKPGQRILKVMPKEILFTIDASLSISPIRLEEVKEGVRYCLSNLNKDDIFNIIVFKDTLQFFSPQSVSANERTIRDAGRFLSDIEPSERTDVFLAFKDIVERPITRTPSNVMLISDGRPTHGVVNSRDLINSVTRANQNGRPVFAFSGGSKVNRYLLDFIAYQNRGWSEFVKSTREIDTGLAGFYDKIRDPLFLNLRYRLNGLEESDVYPKSLPDFYRNAEFTLYGTYENEDEFYMQLLGDIDGKTNELIFTRSLSEAQKGTAEIMKGYAFNKIYHLISRLTREGSNPRILEEIKRLSSQYGITTPYSPDQEITD